MDLTVAGIVSIALGVATIGLLLFVLYLLRSVYALVKRQTQAADHSKDVESDPPPG